MIWCEKVQQIINAFDSNETYDQLRLSRSDTQRDI